MATKLDMNFANGVKDGVSALVLEVQRLEALQEKKDEALRKAKEVISEVVHRAPGYDWNADPLNLTLLTGDTFARIDDALK